MKSTLEVAIKANGLETEIRNMVYHLVRSNGKSDPKSPIQVRKLQLLLYLCQIRKIVGFWFKSIYLFLTMLRRIR